MDHEIYMQRAIEVARRNPDAPFGAVIVDEDSGQLLAEGLNEVEKNPVLHGEVAAIMRCAEAHPDADWSRMTLYTTAEPCPMCSTAILWAGIPRVVYGTSVATLNGLGFPPLDLPIQEISRRTSLGAPEVVGGVLEDECDAMFEALVRRMGEG
ncbi:MAG: nucleoside deaminase [Rubrobacter sp.]